MDEKEKEEFRLLLSYEIANSWWSLLSRLLTDRLKNMLADHFIRRVRRKYARYVQMRAFERKQAILKGRRS